MRLVLRASLWEGSSILTVDVAHIPVSSDQPGAGESLAPAASCLSLSLRLPLSVCLSFTNAPALALSFSVCVRPSLPQTYARTCSPVSPEPLALRNIQTMANVTGARAKPCPGTPRSWRYSETFWGLAEQVCPSCLPSSCR